MITFLTPTALPIEAATTMGVSVKSDGAIGKFGTGLKYAIAGVLRLNGLFTIWINGERFEFTAKPTDIRGKAFDIVHCNGLPCGFTTELGKHWEPWQLFRELASNSLDEGGRWTTDAVAPTDAATVITVECRPIEDAEKYENVFIGEREALVTSTSGATIYAGRSRHFYFKGIRAGSFGQEAPVTIDVCNGELSEDRLLDTGVMQRELIWSFISATKFDHDLIFQIISQDAVDDFWVQMLRDTTFNYSKLSATLMQHLVERRKAIRHPAFQRAVNRHLQENGGKYEPIALTTRHLALLDAGERLCRAVGVDPIPRAKVNFTRDMPDGQLAVTQMDTRAVWFSTHIVMRGHDEFLCGYLEEAIHAMTGHKDCTRELQNSLFSIIVSLGAPQEMRAAA